jgi:hypothetical protein
MRYLLFFILLFLLIRWVTHAYFNRPSVRGPRNQRQTTTGSAAGTDAGKGKYRQVEEAEFEEIEEEENTGRRKDTTG